MSARPAPLLWTRRVLVAAVALMWLVALILPVGGPQVMVPPPDMVLLLLAALVIRRQEVAPAWLAAGLLLGADLLLQRPIGLRAALALLALEALRSRARALREAGFAVEWTMVGVYLALALLGERLVLVATFAERPSLPTQLMELTVTLLAYPLAVALVAMLTAGRRRLLGEEEKR